MSNEKKTVILGASPNPSRYAYTAAKMLYDQGVPFVPVGINEGIVFGEKILDLRDEPDIDRVHTITLYIGERNQDEWIDYMLSLSPKRLIFNPGTENPVLAKRAKDAGIEVLPACTLVLLSSRQF
jgi:uncharacterized protein